jgi:hypothetical protein fulcA4_04429|nr:MAG TPA: tail tape measure [Caudoviricetes sp.]
MSRSINVILNLKDQFTSPLKKATATAKATERSFKMGMRNIKKSVSGMVKTGVKGIAVATGVNLAATGIFIKQSVDAYKEAQLQVTKMESVLKNTKGINKEQINDLKAYTSVLQAKGVVEDDVLKAGITSAGVFGLQADTIKKLLPGMADLAVKEKGINVTSEDMANYGKLLGKAMSGQTGALKKAGIVLDKHQEQIMKTGTETQKAALLADLLKKKVGGVNEAMAQTDQGRIQQLKNDFGDFQEEIGAVVLPVMAEFSSWFMSQLPSIREQFQQLIDKGKAFVTENQPQFEQIKETIFGLGKVTIETVGFIITNFDKIAPIVATVVGAFATYKTAMAIQKTYTMAMTTAEVVKNAVLASGATTVNAITIAQWAWNAAMSANPIAIVIIAVAALIAIGIALYKNWDTVKAGATALWNSLMNFLKPAIDVVKNAFDSLMGGINAVIGGFNRVKDSIGGAIQKLMNWNNTKAENKSVNVQANNVSAGPVPGRKALGTSYFKGGITQINENKRNEVAVLPSGTEILSHEQSKKQSEKPSVSVNVTIEGNVIGNEEYANYVGNEIVAKVMEAYENM